MTTNDSDPSADDVGTPSEPSARTGWVKPVGLIALLVLVGGLFYAYGDELNVVKRLADREQALRDFQGDHPVLVYVVAFTVYVVVTGLSIPGAALMTVAMGWYFGPVAGAILVSFASTAGATVAFLLSRYLFRSTIERRFGERVQSFNEAIEREGAFYLFSLRLFPGIPFFVINVVTGLTRISLPTYWWVSQVGMLPATVVYTYAGSTIPSLAKLAEDGPAGVLTLQLLIAFTLLGLFPLALKKVFAYFRPQVAESSDDSSPVS